MYICMFVCVLQYTAHVLIMHAHAHYAIDAVKIVSVVKL